LAEKFKLPVAEKKDSQGICFVGQIDVKEFLKQQLGSQPGLVLDEAGSVIGEHDGAMFYTIGERHGFTVAAMTAGGKPLYVVAKDIKHNTITVADQIRCQHSVSTPSLKVVIDQTNWLSGEPIVGQPYLARIRYRQPLVACVVATLHKTSADINFTVDPGAVAPGQSLVLYDQTGKICLGGGVLA
jgi:tRNA-specific 2-thiouridylase